MRGLRLVIRINDATLAVIAAGVLTRRYASTQDRLPVPERGIAVSESAVSRRFVALSQELLQQWLERRFDDLDRPVQMGNCMALGRESGCADF